MIDVKELYKPKRGQQADRQLRTLKHVPTKARNLSPIAGIKEINSGLESSFGVNSPFKSKQQSQNIIMNQK